VERGKLAMKPGTKIFLLMLGLMLPYMGFILYRASMYPQQPFPGWFLYVGPCYFFASIALLVVLRKRIVRDAAPQGFEGDRKRLKLLWIGAGLYSLIFLNGLRLGLEAAGDIPLVSIIAGELLNGAILASLIFSLRKVYKRIQQADHLASDRQVEP
jgi:hypothetical protein